MHRLLKRQLKKAFGTQNLDTLDSNVQELLTTISDVYDDFDEQRRMQEHIITVNSEELRNSNAKLKELLDERSELLENKTNENKDIINLLHQYREAIDQTMIVSRTDVNGVITYANDKFCEISGYSQGELLGKRHNIVKHPSNPESMYTDIWQTITSKKIWHGTFANKAKDGSKYYVTSTIVPLIDRNGDIKEFIGLRDDVTKQIDYQEKLKHQTQRLNTIFNSQEHITLILEPNSGIVDVNNKFFETFGFKNLESFNSSMDCVCDLFVERDLLKIFDETNFQWYERFLFTNEELNKVTYKDNTGIEKIFRVSSREIELDEKQHFIITFIDVTELENARKKAEIAKETKSYFLANMSHEIRTPLNAIIGFSDILTKANLNKEDKEYSQIISNSAVSLLDIIDDVLDISKIESGKLHIEEEAFPIHIFIENIVELFSIKAKEKDIRFIYDADPAIPYSIISDSTRLRQVLSNLLSNAIKFTNKKGHVIFCMNIVKENPTAVEIEFIIKDTGIGISNEQKAIIFEPFSQADSGINRKFGGTGLGLAICKDIVSLLGSQIKVESQLSQGSTFSFTLEFKIDKKTDENVHHFSHLEFALSDIIDDSEHLKTNITNYLEKIGDVYEFDEQSQHRNIDFLFCFNSKNLLTTIQKFKILNCDAKTVYVGNKSVIKDSNVISYIDYFIDLPIYGSKIFNIISDNTPIEIEEESYSIISDDEQCELYEKHILVAEDNPNNQKLIEVLIKKLGFECTLVNNGQEAIDKYKSNHYDLILMDINMPVLDGVSATREILRLQKEEEFYAIPIIALTANSIEGDKERYLYAGMTDYMAKPIMVDKLRTIIHKYTTLKDSITKSETNNPITVNNTYNKTDAMKTLGLDETTVDMLLDNFFLTIYEDMDRLEEHIKEKSYVEIEKQAHYIKGSCLNLAMKDSSTILVEIETKAKKQECSEDDIHQLKTVIKDIEKYI